MLSQSVMKNADRDELISVINYALWRHWNLRPKKRDIAATKSLAKAVLNHLELCGFDWRKKPPAPPHSSP